MMIITWGMVVMTQRNAVTLTNEDIDFDTNIRPR